MSRTLDRAAQFCEHFGLAAPILLAPMAGASPPSLSVAFANAGGLGACGAVLMKPEEFPSWAKEFRAKSNGPYQFNLWIPDPAPKRDASHEALIREFLAEWGTSVPAEAGDATPPNFAEQCEALLAAGPPAVSSVMGLYGTEFIGRLKRRGIAWFANVTTVAEARAAEEAGADVIAVQGAEAGGHRGCFDASEAERKQVGLFSLIPAVVDAVKVPVVATGGIADGRGVAAALALGASAVQMGTAFLRSPEAQTNPAWANALARTAPEDTIISRVFSGRAGRSIATNYVLAATSLSAPAPAPYPVQRGLTAAMRGAGQKAEDVHRIQAWAGQSAALAKALPAAQIFREAWSEAKDLLA